jgi:hypothetical protein
MRCFGIDKVPKSRVIHHKDHNRENDNYDNLELLTIEEHNFYHEEDSKANPRVGSFVGRRHSEETLAKMSNLAQARGNNDVWGGVKKKHFESTKLLIAEKALGSGNAMYRHDLDDEALMRCFESTGSLVVTARVFGCSVQCVRSRIEKRTPSVSWKSLSDAELTAIFERFDRNLHRTALTINAPNTSLWRKLKKIGVINA